MKELDDLVELDGPADEAGKWEWERQRARAYRRRGHSAGITVSSQVPQRQPSPVRRPRRPPPASLIHDVSIQDRHADNISEMAYGLHQYADRETDVRHLADEAFGSARHPRIRPAGSRVLAVAAVIRVLGGCRRSR